MAQKHCENVYVDPEETDEKQKERMQKYEILGNEHFSEGKKSEVSVDLVLHPRHRLCEGEVNGPRYKIVSEMLKRLPLAKSLRGCKNSSKNNSWEERRLLTLGKLSSWSS